MVNENTFIAKSLTPLCPQSLCPDMFSEIERSTLFLMRVGAETAAAAAAAVMPQSSRDPRTRAAKLTGASGD